VIATVDPEANKEGQPARTPARVSRRSFLRTCATAGATAASAPLFAGLSASAMSRGKQPRDHRFMLLWSAPARSAAGRLFISGAAAPA
jgi:hypothetical protein